MRYVPYDLATLPNVVVDGTANAHTLLTLSHWPRGGTPAALKADTSAEIAFKYLGMPVFHVACDVVTNNHFDQDGLVGLFVLIDPQTASRNRELLIDVASAGDFGVFNSRTAARINFAVSSLAEPGTSPFPKSIFEQPYPYIAAELYERTLGQLPLLLSNADAFKELWEREDAALTESEEMIEKGTVTIEEHQELDFAVVRAPENLATNRIHRFALLEHRVCHPSAIYNRTACTRILLIQGQHVEFQYRYEGWVQLVSRRPLPRVDLSALADELNQQESGGRWMFDGVDAITPRLYLEGKHHTSIPVQLIRRKLEDQLRTAPPAWNPYDPGEF